MDGVAIDSPLVPLMANGLMYNIENKLKNKMPAFYKRYVDNTLSKMPDISCLLLTLNEIRPSLSFTMKLADNGKLPFLGMVIIRNGPRLDTKAYVRPTQARRRGSSRGSNEPPLEVNNGD